MVQIVVFIISWFFFQFFLFSEEEEEVFQVKKSSHSKKVMRMMDKERRKKKSHQRASSNEPSHGESNQNTSSKSNNGFNSKSNAYDVAQATSNETASRKGVGNNDYAIEKRQKSINSNIHTEIRTEDFVVRLLLHRFIHTLCYLTRICNFEFNYNYTKTIFKKIQIEKSMSSMQKSKLRKKN